MSTPVQTRAPEPSKSTEDSTNRQPFVMTDDTRAKQEARKQAKLAKKAANRAVNGESDTASGATTPGVSQILKRDWKYLNGMTKGDAQTFRLLTWNMLAQTLVHCLRWGERKDMLAQELTEYEGDIICLQEVDRLEYMLSYLPNHKAIRASGPGKLHGLVILYNHNKFIVRSTKTVYYDEEFTQGGVQPEKKSALANGGEDEENRKERKSRWKKARGGTRQTRNIGLMAALEWVDNPNSGIVVGTTHLVTNRFWHPDYGYERTRQILILMRAMKQFRQTVSPEWPAYAAGDFNTAPSEPAYRLLVNPGSPLQKDHLEQLDKSRVIHTSLEKVEEQVETTLSAAAALAQKNDTTNGTSDNGPAELVGVPGEDDEKEEAGESRGDPGLPKNSRRPTEDDGLLHGHELQQIASEIFDHEGVTSLYGSSGWVGEAEKELSYGGRGGKGEEGKDEAAWTSFTPLHLLPPVGESKRTSSQSGTSPSQRRLARAWLAEEECLRVGSRTAWS
ncbi:hypothetical protein QFC21_003772 [Naganishia friedmannii]|uniref:Uncharacterized protein n=1 Tax=Naganishia friedmannii TaxID=89922 RepID=A0ACC2VK31_9TREE|nr:hypothetical protein QFC21_003772 [Naganishia friedmannii]